jgi:gliding motility-associated-like protein
MRLHNHLDRSFIQTMSRKRYTVLFLLFCAAAPLTSFSVFAQQPVVRETDKRLASAGDTVAIKGSGFGAVPANVRVFFGAAQATFKLVNDQLIKASVPTGATFDDISVTNISSGLTGYLQDQFLLSFGGEPGIAATDFETQVDFQAGNGLYDLCLCDFDSDGQTDVATANDKTNSIDIFNNGSTVSAINFSRVIFNIGRISFHATCGDLNGDGKPDLVISEGGTGSDLLFILKNTSAGAGIFTFSLQNIALAGRKIKRTEIADLDADGKPEIIVSDQGGNTITLLKNQSTAATIAFATPQTLTVTGASSTDGLVVEDMDGDRRPEIITGQFLTTASNIFVFQNTSTNSSLNFTLLPSLTISNTVVNLRTGDLDGDEKPDLIATQLSGSGFSVFLNQSTASAIAFASPVLFPTVAQPWGVDIGDLDGDGKVDIAVVSVTRKSISLLRNNSTLGSLNFIVTTLPTTFINRHIKIADIDGDGKPDITFTSVDDNNNSIVASKISVMRNRHCMKPAISPEGPLTICAGFPLQLQATKAIGTIYQWRKDGVLEPTATNLFFDVTATGQYIVTAISEGGACSKVSSPVNITVTPAGALGIAVASNNGPVCLNNPLQLSVTNVGATEYRWTGPNNYIGTGTNPPPIANFSLENIGEYFVEIINGGCTAQITSTVASTVDIPNFSVGFTGSTIFCEGGSKVLSISPAVANFTYQWSEQTLGVLAGETNATLTVTASGKYVAKITSSLNPGCQPVTTTPITITEVSLPIASFLSPPAACAGEQITLTDQSTFDNQSSLVYAWAFGDGNTSTNATPTHTYSAASVGTRTIQLTVSYPGGICADISDPKQIIISNAPTIAITNAANKFTICPDEELTLAVSGGPFESYRWSTGAVAESITINEASEISVEVETTAGCTLSATRNIAALPAPTVTASVVPEEIRVGESAQLTASGLTNYSWSPGLTLSDSTIANPVAQPVQSTSYTVSGKGSNGCLGKFTIGVRIKGEAVVNLLKPANFFSPNGDTENQTWTVENILNFTCGVTIYDDKGVTLYETKKYLNDWEGIANGSPLPNGVYYFIIRCEGQEGTPRTGSITLLK